jgi:hypothetical protein
MTTIRILPAPINVEQEYLAAIHGELLALRSLLTPPAAPEAQDGDTIELREPEAPPAKPAAGDLARDIAANVEVREPARPATPRRRG